MTVYVDDMDAEFRPSHVKNRVYHLSHMVADTDSELHEMAAAIGVKRKWFQGDHYDVTKSARARAIARGAVFTTWRELALWVNARRRGKTPERPPAPKPFTGRLELDALTESTVGEMRDLFASSPSLGRPAAELKGLVEVRPGYYRVRGR